MNYSTWLVNQAEYAFFADGAKYSVRDSLNGGRHYLGTFSMKMTPKSTGGYKLKTDEAASSSPLLSFTLSAASTPVIAPLWRITDHLGSVRVVLDGSANIVEQNDYFPFGLRTDSGRSYASAQANRLKFNGKEQQTALFGIGLIDYGARLYDPTTARWTTQDPLAEKYTSFSPYSYCANDPVNLVDPNGEDNYRFDEDTGTFYLMEETDDQYDQVLKYAYDKKTGEYNKMTRKGKPKAIIENVEKGILKDGINFKTENNTIEFGEDVDLPSQNGVESFILSLANYLYKEIGGVYSTSEDRSRSFATFTAYEKNNDESARIKLPVYYIDNDNKRIALNNYEVIHTHLSSKENKYTVSNLDRTVQQDLNSRAKTKTLRFTIITSSPFVRIPY